MGSIPILRATCPFSSAEEQRISNPLAGSSNLSTGAKIFLKENCYEGL